MIPKKIKISFSEGEPIDVMIEKISRRPNDYKLNHKVWRYFQFDCHDRPGHFENPIGRCFRGYVIAKDKKHAEVIIKILE